MRTVNHMHTHTLHFKLSVTTGTNTLLNTVVAVAVAATVFFSYNIIYAWTTPTATPPGGNVDAPLNVGSIDQVKAGGISANALTAENGYAMPVTNTNDNSSQTAWRVVHNDGNGNFEQYLNTTGGTAPVYETNGYAFRTFYNFGSGAYTFQTSGGTMGAKNGAITWQNALKINPDASISAPNYCDLNGNCFTAQDVSAAAAPYVYLGTINYETNANITTADQDCQAYGYDGVWGTEDRSGSENIICYLSNIVSPAKLCDVKMVSTISDSASGNPVAGPVTNTYQVLQGSKVYVGGWWGQSRSNPYGGVVTKTLLSYVHGGGTYGHSPSQNYLGYWNQADWKKATFSSGSFSKVYHTLTVKDGVNDTLTFHNPTKINPDTWNHSVNPVDGTTVTTISNCH